MNYDIGDTVRLSTSFTDASGADFDPVSAACSVRRRGATQVTTWEWPGEIVRDSVGHFHVDFVPTLEGMYFYRWESTAAGQMAAEENNFYVNPSHVLPD